MIKGWVKEKGNSGDIVPDTVQVYCSKACKDKKEDNTTEKDTSLTLHEVVPEEPEIVKEKKRKIDEFNKKVEGWTNLEWEATSVASFEKWITDMEDFLDAIPDMNSDPTMVYEVTRNSVEEPWKYNGVSYEIDAAWNAEINRLKQWFCKKLNKIIAEATETMTTILQSVLDRMTNIKPIMMILQTVTSMSISLTSVIDWALGIIDLLLMPLKWIIQTIETIMKIIELVVVKFPALISKATSKITSMNCPVSIPSVQVKVNVPEYTEEEKDEYFEKHPVQSRLTGRSSKKKD